MGNARAPESKARRGERRARPFLAGGRSPWLGPSGRVGMRIARNVSKGAQSHFMLNLFFYLPISPLTHISGDGWPWASSKACDAVVAPSGASLKSKIEVVWPAMASRVSRSKPSASV